MMDGAEIVGRREEDVRFVREAVLGSSVADPVRAGEGMRPVGLSLDGGFLEDAQGVFRAAFGLCSLQDVASLCVRHKLDRLDEMVAGEAGCSALLGLRGDDRRRRFLGAISGIRAPHGR